MSAKPAKQLFGTHKKPFFGKSGHFRAKKCTSGAQIKILRPLLQFKQSNKYDAKDDFNHFEKPPCPIHDFWSRKLLRLIGNACLR